MTRSISGLVIVGFTALALAGCGDSGKKDNAASAPATPPPATTPAPAPPPMSASDAPPPMTSADAPAPMAAMVALDVVDKSGAKMSGDPAAGEKIFHQCQTCHSAEAGVNKVGPSLHGIIGRPAGQAPGYAYSDANKNSGKVWNEQTIFDYLENPRAFIPGTKMTFVGLPKPQDRANVISYLVQATK